MKKSIATALATIATLAVALGPGSPARAASTPSTPPTASTTALSAPEQAALTPAQRATFDRLVALLPADWESRRDTARQALDHEPSPAREVLDRRLAEVIDPDDYVCGPTAFDGFVESVVSDLDPGAVVTLNEMGVLEFPMYDAALFGSRSDPDFALRSHKAALTRSFEYSTRFWDEPLDDVMALGMHGATVNDLDRTARVAEQVYDLTRPKAVAFAKEVVTLVRTTPSLERGNNPIFTLNALAFTGSRFPAGSPFADEPDSVIFGDGLLEAMDFMGLGQVGPQAVMGHEVAHHAQFEAGLYENTDLTGAEASRRTEMMADAFASYFATHRKGLGLSASQLLRVQDAFSSLGDCLFDNLAHHGTPNQRRAAASWGIATAATTDSAVSVIGAVRLGTRFDKVLPQLVAPDAPSSPAAWAPAVRAAA